MKNTLRTTGFNNRIISFAMILGSFLFSMTGCQQVNNVVNGNTTANTNTAMNSNVSANSNANSNVTANSNANTSVMSSNSAANTNSQTSNTAANTATATKGEEPLTVEEQKFKDTLIGEWKNNQMTVSFTEDKFEVKYNNGNPSLNGSYRILDEKTVEINQVKPRIDKYNGIMSFKNDGKTLVWKDPSGDLTYTRVK